MSILDQLESTDIIDVAGKVADMSTPDVSSGMDESFTSWYNYVNNTPEFTHILAICLDEDYYYKEDVDWKELLEAIDYIASANFISHSEPNVVLAFNPTTMLYRQNENIKDFIREPIYKDGGPVLKDSYKNGRIRIKLAVEMPPHYRSTKYLNFLVSVRTLFGDSSIVPRDGEFIEVYCRRPNNIWQTILPEAISEASSKMDVVPKFGESNMAYFYKFIDNCRACVPTDDGWLHTDLPEPSHYEIYEDIFKRIILHKWLDCGSSVSHQMNAWLRRSDKVYKKLAKNTQVSKDKWERQTQATITINNKKYILNTAALSTGKKETSASTMKQRMLFVIGLAVVWSLIILLTRIFVL